MPISAEKFDLFASAFQKIILSLAVIVGGGWTLYVFHAQHQVETAKASLAKLQIESQKITNLEITIEAEPLLYNKERYIRGFVVVKNLGQRSTKLRPDSMSGPVQVSKITFGKSNKSQFGRVESTKVFFLPGWQPKEKTVLAGGIERLPFLVRVPSAGIYFVAFSVPRSLADATVLTGIDREEVAIASNVKPESPISFKWAAASYVFVK